MPRLVILDRDGVINHDSDCYIKTADEWEPIEGSLSAIAALNAHSILVGLASNQGGVGRGILSNEALIAITEKMQQSLALQNAHLDCYKYCISGDRNHPDYKPNPGLLLQILTELDIDSMQQAVYFVGDKISDIQAAKAANCIPVLLRTGKGQKTLLENDCTGILVFDDLATFVDAYLTDKL